AGRVVRRDRESTRSRSVGCGDRQSLAAVPARRGSSTRGPDGWRSPRRAAPPAPTPARRRWGGPPRARAMPPPLLDSVYPVDLAVMKTEVVDVNATRKNVRVEIPSDIVSAEIERIARDYSRKARVPGFRPGKTPARVIKQRFKEQILHDV